MSCLTGNRVQVPAIFTQQMLTLDNAAEESCVVWLHNMIHQLLVAGSASVSNITVSLTSVGHLVSAVQVAYRLRMTGTCNHYI
jgi:hypothetical protein